MKSPDELTAFARNALGLSPSTDVELIPLSGRGSGRAYYRFRWAGTGSAILVQYEFSRVENSYFAGIAGFLLANGIPVPRIIRHDAAGGCILMEDLGDTDLWTLRDSSWDARRSLYRKTLAAVHKLHSFPAGGFPRTQVKLMESFGPALYRWERDYFTANFVGTVCGIELETPFRQKLEDELAGLAQRLDSEKQCLVHRDLQSQNVMIHAGEPFLIDFQGMRFGSRFYDLGSLLCDPYVTFSPSEREELLSFYYELSDSLPGRSRLLNAFWEASAQRLMQALGAYGFLGVAKGLKSYLAHVSPGLRNLRTAAGNARSLPVLLELCDRCETSIRDLKFESRDQP